MPQILHSIEDMRAWAASRREQGTSLALVPTMGALHDGHLGLVKQAVRRADQVIVSIFVNPLQFGPSEDLSRYPRTLSADLETLKPFNVAAVFNPGLEEMYPPGGDVTRVTVEGLSSVLCGRTRPTHFQGVTTVVTKLLNIVQPDWVFFGEKDWQQLAIVRQMVKDLNVPVGVIGVPTVRDPSGLALSSRNQYLTSEEVMQAASLYRALCEGRRLFDAGERRRDRIREMIVETLDGAGLVPEYVELVHPETLQPCSDTLAGRCVAALAVHVGSARLIDNVMLGNT